MSRRGTYASALESFDGLAGDRGDEVEVLIDMQDGQSGEFVGVAEQVAQQPCRGGIGGGGLLAAFAVDGDLREPALCAGVELHAALAVAARRYSTIWCVILRSNGSLLPTD